ncbi:hypothetical protein SLH49_11415 [Cognatiyoonia sp. IB215446]|uniref:hypothetical protein n=1 Tax=Cognatiyoonia sp. IB215446 TaxID=3097355 RepID=UPI002A17BE55|nr:hypothetical protein [Cognatiyoonia sp. IB215446]MDX8348595.1 hypothetical protein [Cognatiyoonia sp. IB215446]
MTLPRLTSTVCAFALSAGLAHADTQPSFGVLEFGLEDTLFVSDSSAGTITAYDLPNEGTPPAEDRAFNLLDVDALVTAAVGAEGRIIYNDLAVHPVTRAAYVSLNATIDDHPKSAVVAITQDGSVSVVDLAAIPSASFVLENTADEDVTFWRDIPAPSLTITDLDFVNGELFVSGISTGEFASTLRRIAFPFDGPQVSSSIEMFHAAHGQNETRAPIRAMSVIDVDGVPTVVAAYTCTPLVTIPVEDLQDGAHVIGKTIAELGYGNRPLDVIPFSTANMEGDIESYVLVVNREMDADLISMDALRDAVASPGLSEPIPYLGATVGVQTTPLPLSGVVHAADQDNQFILTMRRDLDTGAMELVSFRKGAFFRLSDFISEYNFPDYAYSEEAQGVRMFQNMLKADEGFPDQIVQ